MLSGCEDDVKGQISRIEEAINDRGHICMFLPALHCEVNWIELHWCLAKWHTRGRAVKTWASLKQSNWDAFGVVDYDNPMGKALPTSPVVRQHESTLMSEYLTAYKEWQLWRRWRSDGVFSNLRGRSTSSIRRPLRSLLGLGRKKGINVVFLACMAIIAVVACPTRTRGGRRRHKCTFCCF